MTTDVRDVDAKLADSYLALAVLLDSGASAIDAVTSVAGGPNSTILQSWSGVVAALRRNHELCDAFASESPDTASVVALASRYGTQRGDYGSFFRGVADVHSAVYLATQRVLRMEGPAEDVEQVRYAMLLALMLDLSFPLVLAVVSATEICPTVRLHLGEGVLEEVRRGEIAALEHAIARLPSQLSDLISGGIDAGDLQGTLRQWVSERL